MVKQYIHVLVDRKTSLASKAVMALKKVYIKKLTVF